jgi:hypothetical protein
MTLMVSLIPLFLAPFLYAIVVKLAAFLFRRTILTWKHALIFGVLAIVIGACGTATNYVSGRLLAPLLTVLLGVAIQIVLGGWYLGSRARISEELSVGFVRGMFLTLIAVGILLFLCVAVTLAFPFNYASKP